jgi:hypothetical protein
MSIYFPSQIVEYIDIKFPYVKSSLASGRDDLSPVTKEYYPVVSLLTTMIGTIPSRVIVLKGDDLIEYSEAAEALKMAVLLWGQGDKNYSIQHIPGRKNRHPIALVRKHLATLSDEGVDSDTPSLPFIQDKQFNESLRTDMTTVNSALDNGEWKAATVLAGSVIEAVLLFATKEYEKKDSKNLETTVNALISNKIIQSAPSNTDDWNLHMLIEVAAELKIITDTTAAQCRIAREFRNLIHPGRAQRLSQTCDRGTALAAVAGVVHVIRDLSNP